MSCHVMSCHVMSCHVMSWTRSIRIKCTRMSELRCIYTYLAGWWLVAQYIHINISNASAHHMNIIAYR